MIPTKKTGWPSKSIIAALSLLGRPIFTLDVFLLILSFTKYTGDSSTRFSNFLIIFSLLKEPKS